MDVFFGILVAFAVFFAVVIFHELGHFLAARKTGVKVLDWLLERIAVDKRAAIPPTHLLRHVFETARDFDHALRVAHRAYVLQHGRIVLEGTGRELLASSEVRAAYLEAG